VQEREWAREQRYNHQADVRAPAPDQEGGRALHAQAGVPGRKGGGVTSLGSPEVATGEVERVHSQETEAQDGCPFSYWTDAAGGVVEAARDAQEVATGEEESGHSLGIEAQDGCPFSYWVDGAAEEETRSEGARMRSGAARAAGAGGGGEAGVPRDIGEPSLEV
jgi:hypothetical protein